MGQFEILEVLKKANKPLSASEIAAKLGKKKQKVCPILSTLLKYEEVYSIEIDRFKARELYGGKINRRMRLYISI